MELSTDESRRRRLPVGSIQAGRPDTILHIGAGRCSELDAFLDANPNRVVLVEPNPVLARGLRLAAQRFPDISVYELAVSDDPTRRSLHVFNHAAVTSLRPATGLSDLYPGLSLKHVRPVAVLPPADLIGELSLDFDNNWLVLDAPGEEYSIVTSLADSHHIERFSYCWVHCGRRPLYEGSRHIEETIALLESRGFSVVAIDSSRDYDIPCCMLARQAPLGRAGRGAALPSAGDGAAVRAGAFSGESLVDRDSAASGANMEDSPLDGAFAAREARLSRYALETDAAKRFHASIGPEECGGDLALARRLAQMRADDLRDLQRRYGKIVEERNQLEALLEEMLRLVGVAGAGSAR